MEIVAARQRMLSPAYVVCCSLNVHIRSEAEQDLTEAALWYEEQSPGLGGQFLDEVLAAFMRIAESPRLYPDIYREVRRGMMRRFPFGIYYRVDSEGVLVIAVMHGSRHPRRWKSRS